MELRGRSVLSIIRAEIERIFQDAKRYKTEDDDHMKKVKAEVAFLNCDLIVC